MEREHTGSSSFAFWGVFLVPFFATVFFSGLGVSAVLTFGLDGTLVAGSAASSFVGGWILRRDRRRGGSDAVSLTATDFLFGMVKLQDQQAQVTEK